ncbi:MAG: YoaK family protein [Jatrophihabitantaceae bacterium]
MPSQSSRSPQSSQKLRHALVVVLTFNAGATDAIGFLALGGAFTSVMTGNLVLFGISVSNHDGTLARHILTAVLCYIAGCVLGARLAGTATEGQPVWPRAVSRALCVELVIFTGYAVGWWLEGSAPHGSVQLALLAGNALALGVQSSSVQRFGVSGLSTTYMTGTLTTMVVRLTSGHRLPDVADSLQILCGLVVGAIVAAALADYAPVLVPLVQLVSVGLVLLGSLTLMRAPNEASTATEAVQA